MLSRVVHSSFCMYEMPLPLPRHLERQDESLDGETVKYGFFAPLHLQGPEVRTIIFANTAEACLSFEMVPRSH